MVNLSNLPDDFNSEVYLDLNSDVAEAGVDAKEHYLKYGIYEKGRKYKREDVVNWAKTFAQSILKEERSKYLPLYWGESNYLDNSLQLQFSIFDTYHQFVPDVSVIKVNDQKTDFTYSLSEDYVHTSFTLKPQEYQTFWAKVDFSFYPHQLSHPWRQSWFVPLSKQDIAIPESHRLLRVIGDTRSSSYLVGGATHATKLAWVLEKDLGLSLDKINVLDWGCGCGRITQFLKLRGIKNLVGADIDKDNIQWCQENIKDVNFTPIPYYPPTQFDDNSFDAITGVSVMTHLTEETHKQWLQELKRILKPGGIALLSVRGLSYYQVTNDPLDLIYQINQEGFVDNCRDNTLDEVTEDLEYYRATYYSRYYLKTVWTQYFEILDIIDGLVLQDVVVLRNPDN